MSIYSDLRALREKKERAHNRAGALVVQAAKNKRSMTSLEEQEFDRCDQDERNCAHQIAMLELRADSELNYHSDPRRAGREDVGVPDRGLYGRKHSADPLLESLAMRAWALVGPNGLTAEQRDLVMPRLNTAIDTSGMSTEQRALSAIIGTAGSYTVPQGFQYELDVALKSYVGIAQSSDYIDTETGAPFPFPSMNDTTNSGEVTTENGIVAGGTGGAAEQDPSFGAVVFGSYMFDTGWIVVPIQLLQDSAFNIEQYLNEAAATRLGRKLNNRGTLGSGAGECTGILTAAPVGFTNGSNNSVSYNDLLDLEHSVDPAYRVQKGVGWMFNDTTLKAVKKLTDGNGRPLFLSGGTTQGIDAPSPDTLNGYPIFINQDMPNIGSAATPIIFGALKKFKIRRVAAMQMIRAQERFADQLAVGLLGFQRFDTNLVDAGTGPVKKLKCAT
jgi:HK97 family phage major capsid protein